MCGNKKMSDLVKKWFSVDKLLPSKEELSVTGDVSKKARILTNALVEAQDKYTSLQWGNLGLFTNPLCKSLPEIQQILKSLYFWDRSLPQDRFGILFILGEDVTPANTIPGCVSGVIRFKKYHLSISRNRYNKGLAFAQSVLDDMIKDNADVFNPSPGSPHKQREAYHRAANIAIADMIPDACSDHLVSTPSRELLVSLYPQYRGIMAFGSLTGGRMYINMVDELDLSANNPSTVKK